MFLLSIASTSIQNLNPFQSLSQILMMLPGITHYSCAKSSRNPHSKFETSPTIGDNLVEKSCPVHASLSDDCSSLMVLVFDAIVLAGQMSHDASHTSICIEDIGPLS